MGNTLNSVHEYLQVDKNTHEYVEQARKLAKNQRPRKGGSGFNQWGVTIIRKLKRGKVSHVSYRTLGACGQFFDTFFRPLLPEVKEITEELLKGGLVSDDMPFETAKKILTSYKSKNPKVLDLKLVVMGETSPDSIKFQNQVEMQNRSAVITESGSNKLAVIAGPIILTWGKNGLIVPRLVTPFNALCILDMRSKVRLNAQNLMKMSEACCHFNKYYDYSPFLAMKQHNEASSHAFVWLLLKETFGLKEYFPPHGAIDQYLKNLLIADDLVNFKGFSFTTDTQIDSYFRVHHDDKKKSGEYLDFYELIRGFQTALDYRRMLKEEREMKKKKLEDFQKNLPPEFKELTVFDK